MKHVNEIKLYSRFKYASDTLGLHKICILNKTSSKDEEFAFWVKIIY